jgi:hypothetical protein
MSTAANESSHYQISQGHPFKSRAEVVVNLWSSGGSLNFTSRARLAVLLFVEQSPFHKTPPISDAYIRMYPRLSARIVVFRIVSVLSPNH